MRTEVKRRFETALVLVGESFKSDGLTPSLRRGWRSELVVLWNSMMHLSGDSKQAFEKIDATLAKIPAARGLRLHLTGDFYTHYAWRARGSGLAVGVTEVGWRKFTERAAEARKALEDAWDLDPTDSQSAAAMITVEMAIGEGNRVEMEKWFSRAMEADSDNLDACNRKLLWLEPKWHGSEEDVLDFGRACRDTRNWRAGIPLLVAEAHRRLAEYLPITKRVDYYDNPAVWEDIHGVYTDYLKNDPDNQLVRSEYAAFCYLCSQYKEAHAEFQRLGDQLAPGTRFSAKTLAEMKLASREGDRRRQTRNVAGQRIRRPLCELRRAQYLGRRDQTGAIERGQRSTRIHDSGSPRPSGRDQQGARHCVFGERQGRPVDDRAKRAAVRCPPSTSPRAGWLRCRRGGSRYSRPNMESPRVGLASPRRFASESPMGSWRRRPPVCPIPLPAFPKNS